MRIVIEVARNYFTNNVSSRNLKNFSLRHFFKSNDDDLKIFNIFIYKITLYCTPKKEIKTSTTGGVIVFNNLIQTTLGWMKL